MSAAAIVFWTIIALVVVLALFVGTFVGRKTPIEGIRELDGRDRDDVSWKGPIGARDELFCAYEQVLAGTNVQPGHDLTLLRNGEEIFPAILDALASAQQSITWHVFWFKPGRLAERVVEVLAERARAGVQVFVLFDRFGSAGLPDRLPRALAAAGANVAWFRTVHWNTLYKIQQRSHMRCVIVDGHVGFTGGFGIDDRWMGDGRHEDQWRDTAVRVLGPAVHGLQGAFVGAWAEATGELLMGDALFHFGRQHMGPQQAGLLYSTPSMGSTNAERMLLTSFAAARERLWITTAYFVPDRQVRRAICDTARRGVDVRILTPGENTDKPSTWWAARAHYGELLRDGVRVYEYRPTMVHAKTLVVDSHWAMVGTLNMDNRSMALNDEAALLAWDEPTAREMESFFESDLALAHEVTLADVKRRGPVDRAKEWAAGRISRLL